MATNHHVAKNAVSSKHSDIDYIENEQIPGLFISIVRFSVFHLCYLFLEFFTIYADIFSQLDDIDTLESGGRIANMDKHMSNLSVGDSKSQGNSANIKLGPVITRKTLSHNSANSLNTLQRLPPQQPAKTRSIPITPEKSAVGKKNESSWPASPARKVSISVFLLSFLSTHNKISILLHVSVDRWEC